MTDETESTDPREGMPGRDLVLRRREEVATIVEAVERDVETEAQQRALDSWEVVLTLVDTLLDEVGPGEPVPDHIVDVCLIMQAAVERDAMEVWKEMQGEQGE